ncbi:hypothetical protein JCM5353_001127 [Sporobolomyces roseus]
MLDVPVTNHLYNLLNSVFPRLPLLTHLTLQIPANASAGSTTTLAEGLIKLVNLEKLRLQSPLQLTPLYDFYHLYLAHKPVKIPHVSFEIGGVPRVTQGLDEGFRCDSYCWTPDLPSTFFRFDWSSLRSLDLRGWSGYLPWADSILERLKAAITGNGHAMNHSSILWALPLSRLSLDLQIAAPNFYQEYRFFTSIDCDKLFNLLALTDLKQLGLLSVDSIPSTPTGFQIKELKVLKLSGNCSFRDPLIFQALLDFLSAFPSLTHLHLVGSSVFGQSSSANEMMKLKETSKHKEMSLYFRFSELGILLVYLRQSSVVTFTYGGEGEQREMRWTLISASEEFDQDCWTL